jgi:hypothetical protein
MPLPARFDRTTELEGEMSEQERYRENLRRSDRGPTSGAAPDPRDPEQLVWPTGTGGDTGGRDLADRRHDQRGRGGEHTPSGYGPYAWAGAGLDGLPGADAGGHRGRGPKGYARSDQRILEDLCDRLHDDGIVDASEIDISVRTGEVTLSGTVESFRERRRAETCADAVSGVRHVINAIRVRERDRSAEL